MEQLKHDVSMGNLESAREELVAMLGGDCVSTEPALLKAHSSTAWSPAPSSQCPSLLVSPRRTSHVSEIMKICSRRKVPVVAYSGGTSFSGALTAVCGGLCIDFKNMDKILAVHEQDMDVVVQPAVDWQELNTHLEPRGLYFPPDPGPGARIGGMIAMSCSGTNAYRHGTMKNWVLSMTVVLADGSVIKTRRRPRKSSAGFDLNSLLVGSEGTLGLVTEAVLKVTSLPENQHVALAAFPTTQAAVRAAVCLITSGLPIDALELLDAYSLGAINHSGLSTRQWKEDPTLFLRFSGSRQAVQDQIHKAQQAANVNGCDKFEVSGEREEIDQIWGARKKVAPSFQGLKKDPSDLFLHADAAVPISSLAEMIDWTHQVFNEAGFTGSTLGHVGDGNYHASMICPVNQEREGLKILEDIQRKALQLEGTITGEHGIGLDLRDMLVEEVGEGAVATMKKVFRMESEF
ncbi:MAG: hypothetical protein Q9200_000743 [Gallowayella weberi]